jgi:formylglycine-generating enzyme required for sulfatase activity
MPSLANFGLVVGLSSLLIPAADVPLYSLTALLDGSGFVKIPAGEFMMGSSDDTSDEDPVHRVRISQGFEMGKVEVTQTQWEAVMRNAHARAEAKGGPQDVNPSHFKGPTRPVESVSWDAVQQFLQRLNARDPKYLYRLPTEAEWEYAARAGSASDLPKDIDSEAWYEANSGGETQAVGQKAPNAWGLYDIFGNVREWVQDWYGAEYYSGSPAADPHGPATGSYKVYRGGTWHSAAKYCRAASREFNFPISEEYSVGFRLVRTPK